MTLVPVQQPPDLDDTPSNPVVIERTFGAGKASAAFVFLLVGQFAAGLTVFVLATIIALAQGNDPTSPKFTNAVTVQANTSLLLAAGVISTFVIFGVARLWAWHLVTDRSSKGIGVAPTSTRNVLFSWLVGTAIAGGYLAVAHWLVPFDPNTPLGPIASAAASGGSARFAWVLLALAVAPVVEEFFFRGLLLAGFAASWGSSAGAIIVTVLFVLLHLPETIHYWPATVAVTLFSIAALVARRTTGSLAPAMAVHAAYNFVIALALFDFLGPA